jgi:4-hydroxy-tetrahydrodipicolinate synthase
MCVAVFEGELTTARSINSKLLRLHFDLFVEANPIPVKWAIAQMGLMETGLRLPLTNLSDEYHKLVRDSMIQAGIQL